jgi:hypothetical protein
MFLPDGAPEFVPDHVWWQIVDLGANSELTPDQVPVADPAGVEVFDNVCQHKRYVGLQDGNRIPYLDVPGIRLKMDGMSDLCVPSIQSFEDGTIGVVPGLGVLETTSSSPNQFGRHSSTRTRGE